MFIYFFFVFFLVGGGVFINYGKMKFPILCKGLDSAGAFVVTATPRIYVQGDRVMVVHTKSLAHLSQGSQGELTVYQWSAVHLSIFCPFTLSNMNIRLVGQS